MMCPKFLSFPVLGLGLLAACSQAGPLKTAPDQPAATAVSAPAGAGEELAALFDCVREEGGLLIAAHRGGPAPGYPENAVETLAHAWQAGVPVMEVDVAESRDGTLFLMHDRSLGRTTTGEGAVADTDWSTIQRLKLVDNDGTVTGYAAPTLDEALDWAVETGAVLELDRKETTNFRNIIEAVREAGAEDHVIMITYNEDEALEVARLAPDLMMTAGLDGTEDSARLIEGGVQADRLIAWTGTRDPEPMVWSSLAERGIESAFGTLGRPGERLDDLYWDDGDPAEYADLIEGGLVMLATDTPYQLARAGAPIKTARDITRKECLRNFD